MKIIVGLGNPGKKYENTRHNVGFMALDRIIKKTGLSFKKEKFDGIYTEMVYHGEKIIFLKPQCYINLSGEVLKKYLDFYKIDIKDILIISDDLDLPVGKIKIKLKGGSGGHNGLKNIEYHLRTKEYKRIKVGISNDKNLNTKDYVLGKFNKEDHKLLEESLDLFPEIFDDYLNLTFENLMNKYN